MNRAETLEQLARLCGKIHNGTAPPVFESTGTRQLDAVLPGGGWQSGTIVELIHAATGIGELSLLMPALARITQTDRHIAFIAPPFIPFAPALANHGVRLDRLIIVNAQKPAEILWASEQTLRCSSFRVVVTWPTVLRDQDIRRMQLAAEAGRSTGFIYRPVSAATQASPAAVRMKLQKNANQELQIDLIKCRGARSGISISIDSSNRGQVPA